MKTVSILPFLCVLAAAAPTLSGAGKEVDIDRRQATDDGDDAGLGGLLGGLRKRQSSNKNNNNDDNDDSLANLLDGSTLAVDGNGQNVDIADLGSLLRNRRRQLHVPAPGATRNSDDNSNSEQVANVLDGSAAGIDRNAQNISVVKLMTKRQLLGGLGQEEGGEGEGNGNGDDDESLLNVLDGDTADVDRNIQNVTILRRRPRTSSSTSVSKRGWLSTLFLGRRGTPTTSDSNNGDNDDSLANVLDGSAAGVNDNAQGVSVLRRRQASPSSSSSASTPTSTPSASASASAVPIAQDPPAAAPAPAPAPAPAARAEEPASHPVVNAADNDNNDNNNNNASNDDALLNAADNSGTSVDRNLQNITILRHKRQGGSHNVDDSGNADDDDDTLANVADGSALKADGNAQGVDVGDLL